MTDSPPRPLTFADRLRIARIAAGLTQAEAAAQIGKAQAQWSLMELGHWSPEVAYKQTEERHKKALNLIGAIAAAVNTTVEDLIGENPITS